MAQTSFIFPSTVAVGGSLTQAVAITVQTAGTLGSVHVVTQGTEGLDFMALGPDTCTPGAYTAGQSCSVSVSFSPKFPGRRFGAVLLIADDGHLMASQQLSAIGTGPLSVLAPGQMNTLAGDGCLSDGPCPSSGTTAATQAALRLPLDAVTDAQGNLYISDTGNNRIRKVDVSGVISTIANDNGVAGVSGDGSLAATAQINAPSGMVIDGAGNVIFADTGNHAIRKIDVVTGKISTIAGTLGSAGSSGDGLAATSALLSSPQGVALDVSGNLLIADTGNNRIRRVNASDQTISTIAGDGNAAYFGDGGPAVSARLNQPWGITTAQDGGVLIADFANNRIRRIDPSTSIITTVAGIGAGRYTGDGGAATAASLNNPAGISMDAAGNLYIADSENNAIRKVNSSNGNITTVAGNGTALYGGNGFSAILAGLYKPYSVFVDGAGNLFVADRLDLRIREVYSGSINIQYPTMKEGKTSAPIAQGIENDGNAPLTLTDLTAAPATYDAALDVNYTDPITTTCSASSAMPVNATCVLGVEFTPSAAGSSRTGRLSIASNASNAPTTINLWGNVLSIDPTSTTVTSNLNPAAVGMAVTFTAHIASPNQATGTVQFFDGATAIGVPQPVDSSSNTATITTSFSVLQSHIITAVYGGDNLDAASNPNNPLTQVILQATSLNVVASANPEVQFTPITWIASVSGWTTAPTGSITFTDGATSLGSAPLNNGVATLTAPPLAVGTHNIKAVFAGDNNDFTSQYTFAQTVNLAPTSTTLATSSAVASFGTPISLTVSVHGVSGATPTGNVNFMDGSAILATSPLNSSGVATYVTSTLPAGTHTVTAAYQGDQNYAGSTSTQIITETISQTHTQTALSADVVTALSGRPVLLMASVVVDSGVAPSGTVVFMNGNVALGSSSLSEGRAALSVSNIAVGTNAITALYSGDANNVASHSQALTITIQQTPTETVVSSSQSPLPTLTPVIISAKVTNGGAILPTGLVTFSKDSVSIGVGALDATGVATITLPNLPAGSHTFSASYAGDALDIPSVSAPFVQVVQPRTTTNALTTSTTSLDGGQQLTLISVIRPTGDNTPSTAPTGTVTFMSGSTTLATTAVDATGVATVTVILSGTSATISSAYSGDANYAASTSSPIKVAIGPAPNFSLNVTPATWTMASKQHTSLQLQIASVRNFTDSFSLGCLGLPKYATCTFSKNQFTLPGGGSQTIELTVDTGSTILGGTQRAQNRERVRSDMGAAASSLAGILSLGLFAARRRRSKAIATLFALAGLCIFAAGVVGCGSIESSGTPPGTYSFVVTATGQTGVSQSVPMTMTITK